MQLALCNCFTFYSQCNNLVRGTVLVCILLTSLFACHRPGQLNECRDLWPSQLISCEIGGQGHFRKKGIGRCSVEL